RVARLEQTLRTLKTELGQPAANAAAPGATAAPPRPPLLVAAGRPRLLALAAREADILALGWQPSTSESQADDLLTQVRAAAGDRFDRLELNSNLISVGDDPPAWLQRYGLDAAALLRQGAVTVL